MRGQRAARALHQGLQRVARQPAHIARHVRLVVVALVHRQAGALAAGFGGQGMP